LANLSVKVRGKNINCKQQFAWLANKKNPIPQRRDKNFIEVSGGLPSVITFLGCPINKIPEPDGLRSFLFSIDRKLAFASLENKKSLSAIAEQGFC